VIDAVSNLGEALKVIKGYHRHIEMLSSELGLSIKLPPNLELVERALTEVNQYHGRTKVEWRDLVRSNSINLNLIKEATDCLKELMRKWSFVALPDFNEIQGEVVSFFKTNLNNDLSKEVIERTLEKINARLLEGYIYNSSLKNEEQKFLLKLKALKNRAGSTVGDLSPVMKSLVEASIALLASPEYNMPLYVYLRKFLTSAKEPNGLRNLREMLALMQQLDQLSEKDLKAFNDKFKMPGNVESIEDFNARLANVLLN
jgi:hypothetical protein